MYQYKFSCYLTREASKYLVEVLESVNPSELDDIIEKVLDAVEKQPCKYSNAVCLSNTQCDQGVHASSFLIKSNCGVWPGFWLCVFPFNQCLLIWSTCLWQKLLFRIALSRVMKPCKSRHQPIIIIIDFTPALHSSAKILTSLDEESKRARPMLLPCCCNYVLMI